MAAIHILLSLYDEAFDHKAWHGTTLHGALRGLDVETASARPQPGRHNIWEIAVHCAYWKYTVRRRLTGAPRRGFVLPGSNWWMRPDGDSGRRALAADLQLLVAEHRALRRVIAGLSDRALASPLGDHTVGWTIRGVVAHDLYHAGQIQLIKRLVRR